MASLAALVPIVLPAMMLLLSLDSKLIPAASSPTPFAAITFPRMKFPAALLMKMPSSTLLEITLPAPFPSPPMVLLEPARVLLRLARETPSP